MVPKISSASFQRLVSTLKQSKKTIAVVEQCCGGLISSSILAQPGASSVYYGGSIVYNTKLGKPLLLNDEALHDSLLSYSNNSTNTEHDEAEAYIQSKKFWTAQTSVAFCQALDVDYAIAEGGAAGPTFTPQHLNTGFAVLAVAGKCQHTGQVQLLHQHLIRSEHSRREDNMSHFADCAADLAVRVITSNQNDIHAVDSSVAAKNDMDSPQNTDSFMLDRATHLRSDQAALQNLETQAQYVVVKGNQILVHTDRVTQLALLTYSQLKQLQHTNESQHRKTFLGLMHQQQPSFTQHPSITTPTTPMFALDLLPLDNNNTNTNTNTNNSSSFPLPPNTTLVDTRTTAPLFSPHQNSLALQATALSHWQRSTSYCTLCGHPTTLIQANTCSQCTNPNCGHTTWPRQDPSMICLVTSRDRQKALLARSPRHPQKLHTALAGFVEVGETFEAAVMREVYEEVGIVVDAPSVRYVKSQPWPFPQSTMVGFMATACHQLPLTLDDKELVSAQWFEKEDVKRAARVVGPTMQKRVAEKALEEDGGLKLLIPPKGVIARGLLDLWLEEEV